MRTCPNCYKELPEDNVFCPQCGYGIEDEGLLYHYTSIDTLNAILSNIEYNAPKYADHDSLDFYNFKLRATHWMFLNDPLEYKFLLQKLTKFVEEDPDLKPYSDAFNTAISLSGAFAGMPYIISLSKCKDSLDMWRSYSKNGAGAAIAFDRDALLKIIPEHNKENVFDTERTYKCRYLDDTKIQEECASLKDYLLQVLSEKNININGFSPLVDSCIVYKHPCYLNEREVRIVLFDNSPRACNSKFRTSNGVNIPYREVILPISIIKKIVIGPCANKEQNIASIKMQLSSISHLIHDLPVEASELPYRQV